MITIESKTPKTLDIGLTELTKTYASLKRWKK